jgi:hypothetical protein
MLEVKRLLKFYEEDVFEEGCIPETSMSADIDVSFSAKTQEEIIEQICDFLGIDNNKENYELNCCEDQGRIDFATMEDGGSNNATKADLEQWKNGKKKLWSCTYTAYVEDVKRSPALLK